MPALESTLVSDRWWEGAVLYQIYPRSFADANGDGIGDLAGILGHLDHLRGTDASLGVDAIWLSPIYPSPLADFGYDITDYTGVAPEFGTLDDLDALIGACHDRGLRLLMDLVPCHTSIEHPWFVESRSSRANPKRDWYLWADPGAGRRAALELERDLRRLGLGVGPGDRAVLPPLVLPGAAGPELAQPGRWRRRSRR